MGSKELDATEATKQRQGTQACTLCWPQNQSIRSGPRAAGRDGWGSLTHIKAAAGGGAGTAKMLPLVPAREQGPKCLCCPTPANQRATGGSPAPVRTAWMGALPWASGWGGPEPRRRSLVGPVRRARFVFSARYLGVSRMPLSTVGVHAAGSRPFSKQSRVHSRGWARWDWQGPRWDRDRASLTCFRVDLLSFPWIRGVPQPVCRFFSEDVFP